MTKSLLRGLVFAGLMVVDRLLQGAGISLWETRAGLVSEVLVALFVVAVFCWGFADGRADARAQADPDRRADLTMRWLAAGVIAGLVGGALAWLISLFYKPIYVGSVFGEMTTIAAFTALLVFLPAIVGVTLGRYLVDRKSPDFVRKNTGPDGERTDVFAAARAGGESAPESDSEHAEDDDQGAAAR